LASEPSFLRHHGSPALQIDDMRDQLNHLLQLVFHTGLPLFLVVLLLVLNALLSQSGALVH